MAISLKKNLTFEAKHPCDALIATLSFHFFLYICKKIYYHYKSRF